MTHGGLQKVVGCYNYCVRVLVAIALSVVKIALKRCGFQRARRLGCRSVRDRAGVEDGACDSASGRGDQCA